MKKILSFIVIAAVLAAGFYASYKYGHIFDFFKREPLSIEKTANVVEEIKKIGEFTTACYYEEMALQDSYVDKTQVMGRDADKLAGKALRKVGLDSWASKADNVSTVVNSDNEILLIGKGYVRAGFNLAKVQESDLNVHGDTLDITLPPTEVFDIIMNPSDFTMEYEKGTWSHELTKPIKERAKATLEQNAIEGGILAKAEENGKKQLEDIFTAFGFKQVNITVNSMDN
ncbi:MAG: DUF4230 domain-containing protein [Bacteroidales bacterium]|nr:DUF4230 domain-containing protein [Bacteroidales bacterium]